MNIVNCYNKNNEYSIDFRQVLEEDEYLDYDEELRGKGIIFTDIAKEPSSVNEIISRTVHNYVINPDDLKYLILDKTVILDATSDNLIKLKNAIKEYAEHFKYMIVMEQGGDPASELKREAGNGRNFYLFTESDRNRLIKEVLDKIIELEENSEGINKVQPRVNINKLKEREKPAVSSEKIQETIAEDVEEDNFSLKEKKKEKFTEKIVKEIKEKAEKKEDKKEKSKKETDKGKKEKSETVAEKIKLPQTYIKLETMQTVKPQEARINRQEEMTVKEMLRRSSKTNNEIKIMQPETEKSPKNFTEERLSRAVQMEHILTKKKVWKSTDNVIIVRGLYGNISATYISLVIANSLQSNNASVAYINDSHNDFLYTVQNYGLKKTGSFYFRENIICMENFMAIPDVNFYIIDSKEAYYDKKDLLLANGFTPFYLVIANGDAKGISFLKNEEGMLRTNGIDNYRIIVKDINAEMYGLIYKELNADRLIEYKHIDDEPFGILAKNSNIANEIYKILDEIDENMTIKEMVDIEEQEVTEEENEL